MASKKELNVDQYLVPTNFISNGHVGIGLQYQHNFLIEMSYNNLDGIDIKAGDVLRWNAVQVSLPGINQGVDGSNINGFTIYHATERSDQDLQITFIEDYNMTIRSYFERWISKLYDQKTKIRRYPKEYMLPELRVHTYSSAGGISTYCDFFGDVFPFEINDLDFNKSSYDHITTTVTFKFKKHLIERK